MAGKKKILVIVIILALAGICGYALIYGIGQEDLLAGIGLDSRTSTEAVSSTEEFPEEQNTEFVLNPDTRSFETAVNKLYILGSEGILDLNNITFRQVTGRFVGTDGLADSWLIGAKRDGQNILFVYNSGEWKEQEWPGPLSEEIIDNTNIISPEDLYSKNSGIILKTLTAANASHSDLTIKDGIYTISIQNQNHIAELKFNADTGEMI